MKNALNICALACNPTSPSPTASMVKVEGGYMTAFGGLYCIRVPVNQDLGVAFDPSAMKSFFRKARKTTSYTVKKNKLVIKEGKEQLTVGCLPADDMVTLDVIAKVLPCKLDTTLLKYMASVIDPANFRQSAHGVTFRDGMLLSTNNSCFFAAMVEGVPDDIRFNLHKDACVAMARFKGKITGVASDGRATKFVFDDNSSFVAVDLAEELPDVMPIFDGDWMPLGLSSTTAEDLQAITADEFDFTDGNITYYTESRSAVGVIEGVVDKKFRAGIGKGTLGFLLRNQGDVTYTETKLRSVNGDVCVITGLRALV